MEKFCKLKIIDWFVIILNVSYYLTIVKVYSFDLLPIQPFIGLLLFTTICYYIRFKKRSVPIISRGHNIVLITFFLIYFFDIIQCSIRDPLSSLLRLITALDIYMFCAYIYQLWNTKMNFSDNVQNISKPYLIFCLYNVVVVLIVAVLTLTGIINSSSNPIESNSLTKVNVESGQTYCFPYYLSLTTESYRILGSFGLKMITGLTHEPHVFCFLILPSFFLILAKRNIAKIRYMLYFVYFFVFIVNFSTTALIALSVVFSMEMIWLIIVRRKMSAIIPIVVLIFLLFTYGGTFIELMSDEVTRKTVDSTSSMEYSARMLKYITNPRFILGSGNMPHDLVHNPNADIGFVTFLLDAVFVIYLCFAVIKMIFNKDNSTHYVGIACLYLLLHSAKTNMLDFNYPYFAMFVFFIAMYSNSPKQFVSRDNG